MLRWKGGEMSDLTDRLRNHSKCAEEEFGHPAEELLEWQAADRIEHLEAALLMVRDCDDHFEHLDDASRYISEHIKLPEKTND